MLKREELIKQIQDYFDHIYFNREQTDELTKKLRKKYNTNPVDVSYHITNKDTLEELPDEIVFQYADVIFTEQIINKYFSPSEIKSYSKIKSKSKSDIYPIEFENVLQVNYDQFVTTISASKLYELYDKQLIIYNTLTQRAPKVTTRNGKESYKIYVNENSVNSIKSLLLRELFIPNDITLNIRTEDIDNFFYDKYNATLTLKDGTFDILDGYHRYQAIIRTLIENPEFDINFILNITVFEEKKAQRFIAQQDKKNRIRASYAKSLDNSRYETAVVKQLNEDDNCRLSHRFRTIKGDDVLDIGKAIDVVGKAFKLRSSEDVNRVEKYLSNELNNFIDGGGKGYAEKFDDLDFRYAIVCLGMAYEQDLKLNYKSVVKKCNELRKAIDSKRAYTIESIMKSVKESEILQ